MIDIKKPALTFCVNKKLAASKAFSIPPAMCSCWNIAKTCKFDFTKYALSTIISSPEPSGSQGELIVYPWSGVRRPSASVVVHRPSTFFKHLLLRNRLADQSQILCGVSLGRGNESLYKWSRSQDQDGRHAHIW